MQEPDNSTGLFDDRLEPSIKEYVFSLLPETEMNSGIAVDVFTLRRISEPMFFDDSEHAVNDVKGYCIATLTDTTLVSVSTCAADSPLQFHIKDNLMLEIEEYVSVEVRTRDRVQRFCSIFSGINTLVEQMN